MLRIQQIIHKRTMGTCALCGRADSALFYFDSDLNGAVDRECGHCLIVAEHSLLQQQIIQPDEHLVELNP